MEKTLQLIPISTQHADYYFCEQLYLNAFPASERRTPEQQRHVVDHNPLFRFCTIQVEGKTVGFLSYWELPAFIYVEHFAVDASLRGQNIGFMTMQELHKKSTKPIILEVERPDTEIARRRIRFYERCGYTLWNREYLQPPYQDGYTPLPLLLMCHGHLTEAEDFSRIKETLYKEVYHYQPERND